MIWPVLALGAYAIIVLWISPRRVSVRQFFDASSDTGVAPRIWLLGVSAAVSWIMAKSINNAINLSAQYGFWGGAGYAAYWLSFIVAGVVIYVLRTRGGYTSLTQFLTERYGGAATKAFLVVIAIRLFNEVWSNTKVTALFFGNEGSGMYWAAALGFTLLTLYYSWRGGLRSSVLTDGFQMLLLGALAVLVTVVLVPGFRATGWPSLASGQVTPAMQAGGLTFLGLALVQMFSYPFHDPVLTDRAFINEPRKMLWAFVLAGVLGGGVILLLSFVGLYALSGGLGSTPSAVVAVAKSLGLGMMLIFNVIMMLSAGSTLDSTFSSTAKFAARDWPGRFDEPHHGQVRLGRRAMLIMALLGNLPLLSLYINGIGPAVIAATTISGTAVMGLAPIFILARMKNANPLSFHLAFWPGVVLGVIKLLEDFGGWHLQPAWMSLGQGDYAATLGLNVFGVILCTLGFLVGNRVGVTLPAAARAAE